MNSPWRFLLGMRDDASPSTNEPVASTAPAKEHEVPRVAEAPALDQLGQQNELLHVRCSYMADRLDDLKSLSADFALITKPFEEMAAELPKSKARILELEALHSRELGRNQKLNAELNNVAEKHSVVASENVSLSNHNKSLQDALDRSQAASSEDRVKIVELGKLLSDAQQQVAGEAESRKRLEFEISELSDEIAQKNETLQRLENTNADLAGRNAALEKEVVRQQAVVEKQVLNIVDLQSQCHELDKVAQERLQENVSLLNRLETERSDRQQSDHRHEAAMTSVRAENSSLFLKIESLNASVVSAEHAIAQAREQLAEKEAALRLAEDSSRVGEKQRGALDRQVAILSHNFGDATNQLAESQRLSEALAKRCDMLTKALSAKDAALEGALDKARARSERVDELTKRLEHDRSSLEAVNRRLVEELENEKAERMLAQGALTIARESRSSLQRLNESLKRANRALHTASSSDEEPGGRHENNRDEASNVSIFTFPSKERRNDE